MAKHPMHPHHLDGVTPALHIVVPYPEYDGQVLLSDSTCPGGFKWGDFAQGPVGPRGPQGKQGEPR